MMIKRAVAAPASLFILLLSCNGNGGHGKVSHPDTTAVKRDTVVQIKSAYENNPFNNVTQVYAGIVSPENPLRGLLDSSAWKQNTAFMESSWQKLEKNRLSFMRNWSKKELAAVNKTGNVFYPFSGPDFITADCFFPHCNNMVMLGLEPVGALPKIEKMSKQDVIDYSNSLKKSLTDLFEKSYFITEYMLRDFQRQKVNGTLPVLCFFIARCGYQITDVHYMTGDSASSIAEVPYDTKKKIMGVKISCKKDSLVKQVYYFRYDVSNQYFADPKPFYKFVNENTAHCVTFVKSASYVLHANFMTNMKKLILQNSDFLLEDDTGIPYDEINKTGQWQLSLYGEYSQPIKNFPYLKMQKSIVEAYRSDSASVPKLPFHLGYHWQTHKDILIYGKKKKS